MHSVKKNIASCENSETRISEHKFTVLYPTVTKHQNANIQHIIAKVHHIKNGKHGYSYCLLCFNSYNEWLQTVSLNYSQDTVIWYI